LPGKGRAETIGCTGYLSMNVAAWQPRRQARDLGSCSGYLFLQSSDLWQCSIFAAPS
jgi:hypothetical protein